MSTPRRIDLAGQVFARLTVIRFSHVNEGARNAYWVCACSCGREHVTSSRCLRSGNTKSCGCLHAEVSGARFAKRLRHGQSNSTGGQSTAEYRAWQNMISRCENMKLSTRKHYGGRGIQVCRRWRESFEAFFADVGERPSPAHSLDRFPDHNGNYEPGNVRWATWAEQQRNKRNNNMIEHNGERLCEGDWCRRLGVTPGTVRRRLAVGWSVSDSVTKAPRESSRRHQQPPREAESA